jgi:hypothetical protein
MPCSVYRIQGSLEPIFLYEVETIIETTELADMPITGLRSSRWDACKNKAYFLEKCLSDNDYNPDYCQPQLFDLKKCCEKYRVSFGSPKLRTRGIESLSAMQTRCNAYVAIIC